MTLRWISELAFTVGYLRGALTELEPNQIKWFNDRGIDRSDIEDLFKRLDPIIECFYKDEKEVTQWERSLQSS